jgi:hypothetical protein
MPAIDYRLVLGCDPGASSGLALVGLPLRGAAQLHGLWQVHGSSGPLWWARAQAAAAEACLVADGLEEGPHVAAVEEIPATFRDGSIVGLRKGHSAWAGLGQRRGLLLAALYTAGWQVEDIDQRDWTAEARVQASKQGVDPWVRVREAGALVTGAAAALAALPQDSEAARARVVDAAEAVLIGLGAALRARAGRKTKALVLRPPSRRRRV